MNEENLRPKKLDTSPEKQRKRDRRISLLKKLTNRKYCDERDYMYSSNLWYRTFI